VTDWAAFAGIALAVLGLLLVLAHLSARGIDGPRLFPADVRWLDTLESDADHLDVQGAPRPSAPEPAPEGYSTLLLVVNVALSQGLLGFLLLGGAFLTQVPASSLGVSVTTAGPLMLGVGVVAGVALAGANTAAGLLASWAGHDPSADLRELLTPETRRGWVLLLGVALPVVAGFEELLFRGVLVGAFAAGFGLSPWLLAVLSSVAFALGHGAQGPVGILVTGTLGFLLAALFVVTGSLLAVVVAHYLVNALEFVGHELGLTPLAK
jgi:membrane protease YdiL (CAAX protease family)